MMRIEAPMFDTIAGNLRRHREKGGLSQAQLARKAGITRSTLRKAEDGLHSHQRATMTKIAQALEVDVQTLLG